MKRFALVHFRPMGIIKVACCAEENLPAILQQFSDHVGEKIEYKDGYPHQLNDGSLYQIVEVEPF